MLGNGSKLDSTFAAGMKDVYFGVSGAVSVLVPNARSQVRKMMSWGQSIHKLDYRCSEFSLGWSICQQGYPCYPSAGGRRSILHFKNGLPL
jgi:hypothetical protein